MTLFKQLALVISFISIFTLGSVMYLNYATAKQDMIENLYQSTVNNISTLSNKLSNAEEDEALIGSIIDSEFDSGYFKQIKFTSSNASFEYEQIDNEAIEGVPSWFINFTKIHMQSIKSDVSAGWSTIGEVEVLGDTGIIYKALYKMLIHLLYLFVILSIVSHIILSVLLHYVLKPLKAIQNQAEAIIRNEFVLQTQEPYTKEFKDVVKGMNSMVKKVEDIFNKANESAQRNKELLYNDPVTKLYNRRYLMLKLSDLIKLENSINGGTALFVAFSSIEAINTLLGRQNTDILLERFAANLRALTLKYDERLIARVNSTEFTLMLCNCESDDALIIAGEINALFNRLLIESAIPKEKLFLSIGLYRYTPQTSITNLLTCTDNALSKAKADEKHKIFLYEDNSQKLALGKEQWRSIIEDAIKHNHFELKFWSMVSYQTRKLEHKLMTFTINAGTDKHYLYGDFIAPAINLGLVGKIYLVALEKLMSAPHKELQNMHCSVRLSNEFLKDNLALQELSALLEKNMQNLPFKLSFEIADNFASNNIRLVKSFVQMFKTHTIEFGLNAFTSDSDDFTYLKTLNPKFIKADSTFLLDQSPDSMNTLHVVTDALGIDIIATFVKTQEELDKLQDMHIYKVQGPITDSLSINES